MSFIGTKEELDKLKSRHPDWFQPNIVEGKGNALKWIESKCTCCGQYLHHPENGLFKVYWKDVISPHEGNVTFDENEGQGLRYKWEYKDGKMVDGISQSWYPNGQLKSTTNWKDGHRNGLWISWFENGQKKCEVNFKDGLESELSIWYDRSGQMESSPTIEALKAMANPGGAPPAVGPHRDEVNIYNPVFANNKIIYDGCRRKIENQHLRLDFIDVKGKTVVDIGCNSGYITTQLLKRGASYCLGIDLHREMIDICNLIKEIDNLDNIDFVQSPAYGDIGYRDEPPIRCVVKNYPKFDIGLLLSVPHGYNETLEWVSELIIEDWADIWYIESTNHPDHKLSKEEIKEWGETELSKYGDVEFLTFTDYQHRGLFRLDVRKE